MKLELDPIQLVHKGSQCLLLVCTLNNHRLQIMLDCGINQQMDLQYLKHYEKKISKSQLILLSQAAIEYAGGIPIIHDHKIPTLATSPVIDYGYRNFVDQLLIIQQGFQKSDQSEEDLKNEWKKITTQAEAAYKNIKPVNQGKIQKYDFFNGLFNVVCEPIRAGKVIGSCVWKIQINTVNIIYMADFNMNKELHVDALNVEKLIIRNQLQNHPLQKEKLDLLILDSYPITQQQQQINSIKQIMEEQINKYIESKSKGYLIYSFYPNERILEGIMALDYIFNEYPKAQQLKCDVLSNYSDIVKKAGGQFDFLASSMSNWKNLELQVCQSPFDPDHLRARFSIGIKQTPNIILTTFNNLFCGPSYNEKLLSEPFNQLTIFGQPNTFLNNQMGNVKVNIKEEVNFKIKDSVLSNLNQIKKLLIGEEKDTSITQNLGGRSQVDFLSQTDQQTRQFDKQSDDSVSLNEMPTNDPIFIKLNYKYHSQKAQQNLAPDGSLLIQDKIIFNNQYLNQLRPLPQLFGIDNNGYEIPEYIQKDQTQVNQIMKKQEFQALREEQEPKIQEDIFTLPKFTINKPIQVQAKIFTYKFPQNNKNGEMLLQSLKPENLLLLNSLNKPKYSDYKILIAKDSEKGDVCNVSMGLQLPFVKSDVINANAMKVKGKLEQVYDENGYHRLLQLESRGQPCQIGQRSQLIELFEELQQIPDLNVFLFLNIFTKSKLGFGQISVNNGSIIVNRVKDGFRLEGMYSSTYKLIRDMIKNQRNMKINVN